MKLTRSAGVRVGFLFAAAAAVLLQSGAVLAEKNAFDEYIEKPDPAYSWEVKQTLTGSAGTAYIVDMTSQTWRTKEDVDRTEWQHWLSIARPKNAKSDTAFLFIGGGSNDGDPPNAPSSRIVEIARKTNCVVAELSMIPNQPLTFHGDGKGRKEDDLIGYAWDQYLKTGDPTWLPRFPMVKATVRAMDTIQKLMASGEGGNLEINEFVVAGGSKRGWTTWMTGAADKRVAAIVPIVIDVVNVEPSMNHHFAAYGFWAPAVGDYVRHKIMERTGTPELQELYKLVDPYFYRDRLTMPKFIVNGSGDQFFLPDSSQFYFDDLQGDKYLRYVPNADHSLRDTDAMESIVAFYMTVANDSPRPEYSWTLEGDDTIRVTTKTKPKRAVLWQAVNPNARDFRLEKIGKAYRPSTLKPEGDGVFVGTVDIPEKGWKAFFVELEFETEAGLPLKMTTQVRVVPDTLPFADKDPAKGTLPPRE